MTLGPRTVPAVLLVVFLAWQAGAALVDLVREADSVPDGSRRRALVAPAQERIDASVEWIGLYHAIEAGVPEEAIVAFCFPLDLATFGAFYHVVPLIYPRRAIPMNRALPADEVEKLAERARTIPRPTFIVDLESGFPLPMARTRVAAGPGFTVWRLDR
jgi:hypothetical protein